DNFKEWLTARWKEKDTLLEWFESNGAWREDSVVLGWKEHGMKEMSEKPTGGYSTPIGEVTPPPSPPAVKRDMKMPGEEPPVIETDVKLRYWWHAFDVFTVLA